MNLIELATQFPDMNITIRLGDLVEANKELARQTKEDVESAIMRSNAAKNAEGHSQRQLSRRETCQRLNVSLPTLYRWDKLGYLRPTRIGRKVCYQEADINRLLTTTNQND